MIVLCSSILPHIESFRSSTKRRMETAPLRRGRFCLRRRPTCPCCSSRKWPRHTPKRQQRACSHCPGTTADEAAEVATSDRSCQRADSPARIARRPIEALEGLYCGAQPSTRNFDRERGGAFLCNAPLSAAIVRGRRYHLLVVSGHATLGTCSPTA